MPDRKLISAVFGGALLALIAFAVWPVPQIIDHYSATASFTLKNLADERIVKARVAAFGRSANCGPIPARESCTVDLLIAGEGGFTVEAEFASGVTVSSGAMGYLTTGAPMKYDIDIDTNGAAIAQASVNR